jgi:hypothetical protein
MSLILTDVQKVELSISPTSAAGNPAPLDGTPVWSSSDESVLAITASEDGLSAVAVTTGKLGRAQVNVSADADLGDGVKTITGVLDVEVRVSEAVSLAVSAGSPTDK